MTTQLKEFKKLLEQWKATFSSQDELREHAKKLLLEIGDKHPELLDQKELLKMVQ